MVGGLLIDPGLLQNTSLKSIPQHEVKTKQNKTKQKQSLTLIMHDYQVYFGNTGLCGSEKQDKELSVI